MKGLPTVREVAKEAAILLAATVAVAFVVGQLPALRDWINEQWGRKPKG